MVHKPKTYGELVQLVNDHLAQNRAAAGRGEKPQRLRLVYKPKPKTQIEKMLDRWG